NGTVTFAVTNLAVGMHQLFAAFAVDASYNGSRSNPNLAQTVMTISPFTLSNGTITQSGTGLRLQGNATLPFFVNPVPLTGTVTDATHYSLSVAPGPGATVGGYSLTTTSLALDPTGLSLKGDATLPLVGKVPLTADKILGGSSYTF